MEVRKLGFVRELDNGFTEFRFEPGVVYPAIAARIKEVLRSGALPQELVFPEADFEAGYDVAREARNLIQSLRLIPAQAWENALRPRTDFDDHADALIIIERKNALEAILAWLTLACRVAARKHYAMIYIAHDPRFKL